MTTNPLTMEILGAICRWLMTLAGSYLVAHHVLTTDQADSLTTDVLKHLTLAAPPIVGALALSLWQKVRKQRQLAMAIDGLHEAIKANRANVASV